MAVRLIAGRAGSGKTELCLSQIREELVRDRVNGPRMIFLVPEQAGLQMERALLASLDPPVLGRCDVLSFRRLAHRVLNETTGPSPVPLSPIGRQMALRHLLALHRGRLREFDRVADRTGFLHAVADGIVELIQEAVTVDQLERAARAAAEQGDPSAPRLSDMAVLYRAYLDYLGSERVDPEGVLDLAAARLDQLDWPDGAMIWMDGFAGLTRQQVDAVVALARRAARLEIALLLDPTRLQVRRPNRAPDDLSLFARTERTWFAISRALTEAGVALDEPLVLDADIPPRFARCPELARLERRLFHDAPRASPPDAPGAPHESSAPSAVRIVRAADRREEVTAALTALVDLVTREQDPMRYRDVAVVVRDLTPYHDLVSAELAARNIPFFIDRRRPTFHTPVVQFVRGLVGMIGGGAFDEGVFTLLKTGLTAMADEQVAALENYAIAYGLSHEMAWREAWAFPPQPQRPESAATPAGRAALDEIDEARKSVMDLLDPWIAIEAPDPMTTGAAEDAAESAARRLEAKELPCVEWVRRLFDTLERFGVRNRLRAWAAEAAARGDLDEAQEHTQVWTDLVHLLDEAVAALGDAPTRGRRFREIIESGLAEFSLGLVPATLDQVLVGSIERSRHPPVRAVFVLGFGEGQFPARPTRDELLGDEERGLLDRLGVALPRTRVRQILDERMLAYIAATRPGEFLWISYPEADETGRPLAPSGYLESFAGAAALEVESAADALHRGSDWPADAARISSFGDLAAGVAGAMYELAADARFDDGERESIAPDRRQAWTALYEWARRDRSRAHNAVAAALTALAPARPPALSPASREILWPAPHRTSVTALEQFARCPFQHYAAQGLRLAPRARHEVSALDLGRIYHAVLEQFVVDLHETGRSLREMSSDEIAAALADLCRNVVPKFAEEMRLEPGKQRAVSWRGRRELSAAQRGQRATLGRSGLRPVATELPFGASSPGALPAIVLRTANGKTVRVVGKIDRVDLLEAGDEQLGIVFDYKRAIGRRLRLDEVYHGLALQLLAYLLVLREHGGRLPGAPKIIPGGTFYLPLLASYERVEHPDDAQGGDSAGMKPFQPRGVFDFDWIDRLDPQFEAGWSKALKVFKTKEGKIGHRETGDAVEKGMLPLLLDHVRARMEELATRWLAGDISVAPALFGGRTPCSTCLYRSVCRLDYAARQGRRLERLTRSEALERIMNAAPAPPHNTEADPS